MSKPNPFKDRQARKAAGRQEPSDTELSGAGKGQAVAPFAQGRPEKMLSLSDLPDPVETPDAMGDLSEEEEQILALCMRGVQQFEDAWWVMGKAMANISSRRLYRKTHPTFADFARDTFNKSRPIAYEEMTSYAIGELLSARADKVFESNSNDVSVRADSLAIGKKAAGALNPITKDYGADTSVAVYETIKDATGRTVTVKAITGIVQQLPRKEEKELTREQLLSLARDAAATTPPTDAAGENRPLSALHSLRDALAHLEAAHRALAPARTKRALEEDPEKAAALLASVKEAAARTASRAGSVLPRTRQPSL